MPAPTSETATTRHSAHLSKFGQLATLVRYAVMDRWHVAFVIGLLTVGMGAFSGALWPSLRSTLQDLPGDLSANVGKALGGADLTTGAGFVNAEAVSLVIPLAVIAAATLAVVRAVAVEEQSKTLGVTLSAPVARGTFLLAKALATAAHVSVVAVLAAVGLASGSLVGDLGLSWSGIVGVALHAFFLGVAFGSLGLLVAAASGTPRLTTASVATATVVAFLLTAFLPLFDSVANLARVSPWYYFNGSDPLTNGADPAHLVVLASITLALTVAALASFARRDLRG
ncbi:MAG: ABC transporter permease subunit [Nocardioides sp.]